MCADDGTIEKHADFVVTQHERMKNAPPHVPFRPAIETVVDRLPRPKTLWEVTPRRPGLGDPENGVDEVAIASLGAGSRHSGQQLGNLCPSLVGQFVSVHYQGRSGIDRDLNN